ncbi:MAG: membrane protein insertase YidC, partial [Myxococcaceae bacterium]
MDSQKRLLIALGLSFLLTMVYVTFFVKPPVPSGPDGGEVAAAVDAGAGAPVAVTPPPVPVPGAADAGELAAPVVPPAEQPPPVKLDRDHEAVEFTYSSEGAALVRAELQGAKMREQPHLTLSEGLGKLIGRTTPAPPQMDLTIPAPGLPPPFSVSIEGSQPLPANTFYKVAELPDGALEFTAVAGTWQLKKTYAWKGQFQLTYTLEVKNIGAAPAGGELAVHVLRAINPLHEEAGSFFGGIGNQSRTACFVGEEFEHQIPDAEKPPPEFKGPLHFIGIDQQYFLSALYPMDAPRDGRCVLTATPTVRRVSAYFPLQLAPGQAVTQAYGVFIGPKDPDELQKVTATTAPGGTYRPELEKTVDFGIWAVIVRVLLWILKFFHGLSGNWGVAIILLTVMVKIVLLPLTHKSMV